MSCTDTNFGSDPWPDQEKQCWCENKPAYKPWKCAEEGEESMSNGTQDVYYSSQVLIGNGINFEGQVYTIPLAGEWDQVYDADFYDLDGNGSIEIITNFIKINFLIFYIQQV